MPYHTYITLKACLNSSVLTIFLKHMRNGARWASWGSELPRRCGHRECPVLGSHQPCPPYWWHPPYLTKVRERVGINLGSPAGIGDPNYLGR